MMDIGGQDISFETDKPVSISKVKDIIKDMWPGVVFETESNNELFAYQDKEAKDSWDECGITKNNGQSLLYITLDGCYIHIVHDDEVIVRLFINKILSRV